MVILYLSHSDNQLTVLEGHNNASTQFRSNVEKAMAGWWQGSLGRARFILQVIEKIDAGKHCKLLLSACG